MRHRPHARYICYYQGFIPTCPHDVPGVPTTLANPWGPTLGPAPTGNPADITQYLPNRGSDSSNGAQLFSFATYNRTNKLPYTINYTLDIQWQPRNDLAIEIGYVGNLGRHEVIPIPFNQPGIASPTNIIHPSSQNPQQYTYGYTVQHGPSCSSLLSNQSAQRPGHGLPTTKAATSTCAFPISVIRRNRRATQRPASRAYNALQTHVEKRMSHGLQFGFSYTYSHALDEQSGMGLFFNGNNPLNLRSAYGSSDFDRTHVFNFSYLYELPKFFSASTVKGKIADGWAVQGSARSSERTTLQRHRLYRRRGQHLLQRLRRHHQSHCPLAPGCTPKNAVTGYSGANAYLTIPTQTRSSQLASPCHCSTPAISAAPFPPAILSKPTSPTASATSSANPGRSAPIISFVKLTPHHRTRTR